MSDVINLIKKLGSLNFTGLSIPLPWLQHPDFRHADKVDFTLIIILADIINWYQPKIVQGEMSGQVLTIAKRFADDLLNYDPYVKSRCLGLTPYEVRTAISTLTMQGFIERELRTIELASGKKLKDVPFVRPVYLKIRDSLFYGMDEEIAQEIDEPSIAAIPNLLFDVRDEPAPIGNGSDKVKSLVDLSDDEHLSEDRAIRRQEIAQGFEFWQEVTGKKSAKFTPERESAIKKILFPSRKKDAFTLDQLKEAILGCLHNPWFREKGLNDLTTICKSGSSIEKHIAFYQENKDQIDSAQSRGEKLNVKANSRQQRTDDTLSIID